MWCVDGVRDKYKRSLAETENVRQRLMKQVQGAKEFGFRKDLLEEADVLGETTDSIRRKIT